MIEIMIDSRSIFRNAQRLQIKIYVKMKEFKAKQIIIVYLQGSKSPPMRVSPKHPLKDAP